jgi:hypothetical protein
LPITLLQMTTSVMMKVLGCSGSFSDFWTSRTGGKLVACVGRDGRLPVFGHELLALGAERHVLSRLF